jgi:hypothetical protein
MFFDGNCAPNRILQDVIYFVRRRLLQSRNMFMPQIGLVAAAQRDLRLNEFCIYKNQLR